MAPSQRRAAPEGKLQRTTLIVEEGGKEKYLSISSGDDICAAAICSRSKVVSWGAATEETDGGRRLKASATTLSLPDTWQMSEVNSEI